jgi:hypothetical protein
MVNRPYVAAALLAVLAFFPAASVQAQGEIVITQAKANAGPHRTNRRGNSSRPAW